MRTWAGWPVATTWSLGEAGKWGSGSAATRARHWQQLGMHACVLHFTCVPCPARAHQSGRWRPTRFMHRFQPDASENASRRDKVAWCLRGGAAIANQWHWLLLWHHHPQWSARVRAAAGHSSTHPSTAVPRSQLVIRKMRTGGRVTNTASTLSGTVEACWGAGAMCARARAPHARALAQWLHAMAC